MRKNMIVRFFQVITVTSLLALAACGGMESDVAETEDALHEEWVAGENEDWTPTGESCWKKEGSLCDKGTEYRHPTQGRECWMPSGVKLVYPHYMTTEPLRCKKNPAL